MTQQVDRLESSGIDGDIEACRTLLGDVDEVSAQDLGALRERVTTDQSLEQGFIARLRALPTPFRIALILAVVTAVTVASVVLTPRVDLAQYPSGRMAVSLSLLAVVAAAATWRLLRPLYAPPPSVWSSRVLLIAGVLLPCALALVPIDHAGVAAGTGSAFAAGCVKCLGFGGAMGFPVLLLAFFARRSRIDGAAVAALAGVAAGLTGMLTLQLHCPITDPMHLLAGHALLIVLLGAAAAKWHR